MKLVFEGVRVLEVAEWTFVPSAAAILAEFGADVIKVERPSGGDIQRGLAVAGVSPLKDGVSLQMEASNRGGKRSVGVDITTREGQELVLRMAREADVFLTSLLPKTLARMGFRAEDVMAVNPRIIYAAGTGLGTRGPEVDRGGYDMTAYWCRSGIGYALTPADSPSVVEMRPAIGDRLGGMNLVAGVAAALFHRERTGEGTVVDVSLLGTGLWQAASDLTYSAGLGIENSRVSRGRNPLAQYYRTADDRWLVIALLESDRWWPRFAEQVGLGHLVADDRFVDAAAREANFEHCREVIAAHFASQPLSEWRARLGTFPGPWEPVQSMLEVAEDPQVIANGMMKVMESNNGTPVRIVTAPIQFDGEGGRLSPCPEPGAHTEEVLLEFGLEWDEIVALKDLGSIT